MSALDAAVAGVDALSLRVEAGLSDPSTAPPLLVDPDDPWADTLNPPAGVFKARAGEGAREQRLSERPEPPSASGARQVRCPTTGYLRTLPFERNNPMPGAFVKDCSWLDGLLAPVVKPKGAAGAAPAAAAARAPEAVGARAAAAKAGKAAAKAEAAAAAGAEPAAAALPPPAAASAPAPPPTAAEAADAFAKARLVVGRVLTAGFVDGSDKLYVCSVEVGEPKPRQVITGLRKFVAQDALAGAAVVVVANLKPAKLAGLASEAMILAAEEALPPDDPAGRRVYLLRAPEGAAPGTRVLAAAAAPAAPPPKECKSAAWAAVKAALAVRGGVACWAGEPLRTAEGEVTIAGPAPDGAPIG